MTRSPQFLPSMCALKRLMSYPSAEERRQSAMEVHRDRDDATCIRFRPKLTDAI